MKYSKAKRRGYGIGQEKSINREKFGVKRLQKSCWLKSE